MTLRSDVVRFGAVWGTSAISGVGSSITAFAFGVYIYLATGSEVAFAGGMLAAVIPPIILGPISGVVVDRFNRRWVLILTDAASAVAVAVVAYLMWTGQVQVWHLYVAAAISAAGGTFHHTAYAAMTPMLIPKRHLARANGLMQIAFAAQIAAPLGAAAVLPTVGFAGVLVIDLVTFVVAVVTLLVVRLPRRLLYAEQPAKPEPVLRDILYGWRYLAARTGMRSLVTAMAAFNFCFAAAGVLVQPLVLSFGTASTLGVVMFVGGAGMFVGSLVMGAWGGPKRRVRGVAGFFAVGGVALVAHALYPSAVLLAAAGFLMLFTLPIVNGAAHTVLQLKVEPAALGRVMGTSQAFGRIGTPVAYLLAAPLAEYVTGPMLEPGGALAGNLGTVIGTGPGRGIAALFLFNGVLLMLLAAVVWAVPALRRLETDLPDALPEDPREPDPSPSTSTESSRVEPVSGRPAGT